MSETRYPCEEWCGHPLCDPECRAAAPPADLCLALAQEASLRCEFASEEELEAWAALDTLLGLFAQKELVYRDQRRFIDATECA